MGWKRDLRKKLRRRNKELKISKRFAKRAKKILGDMSPEEIAQLNATGSQVTAAADQLAEAGYQTSDDPTQTMAQYNDVYGDGNGEYDEYVPYAFEDYENGESFDQETWEDSYEEILGGVVEIADRFLKNRRDNGADMSDLEEYEFAEQDEENTGGKRNKNKQGGQRGIFGNWFVKIKNVARNAMRGKDENYTAKSSTMSNTTKIILGAIGVLLLYKLLSK